MVKEGDLPKEASEEVHGNEKQSYKLQNAHFGRTDVEHGCSETDCTIEEQIRNGKQKYAIIALIYAATVCALHCSCFYMGIDSVDIEAT